MKKLYFKSLKITYLIISAAAVVCILILFGGCAQKEYAEAESQINPAHETKQTEKTEQTETTEQTGQTTAAQETKQLPEETETTEEQVPDKIKSLMDEADNYYNSGEYAMAKTTYRKAEIAINGSELSEETRENLVASFYDKYIESKEITETARMHYGNAMQLKYVTRYEEALQELEKALEIYPKYTEAQEAYDELKVSMNLS